MTFPHEEQNYYGSVQPMCDCGERTALTNARIKELERWTQGTEQGDVCAGSIKMNKQRSQ